VKGKDMNTSSVLCPSISLLELAAEYSRLQPIDMSSFGIILPTNNEIYVPSVDQLDVGTVAEGKVLVSFEQILIKAHAQGGSIDELCVVLQDDSEFQFDGGLRWGVFLQKEIDALDPPVLH
jgi:hypothetical protein